MLRIKNWSKFQHFRDRKPPWVKLYRDVLDDMKWHELDPTAAKVLVMLWLIASEDEGRLPATKELSFRLRLSEKVIESTVSKLDNWLERDDITPISERYQDDALETETETYKEETEQRQSRERSPKGSRLLPDKIVELTSAGAIDICKHMRPELNAVDTFASFTDYWTSVAGAKGVKLDWMATWRNWIRNQKGNIHANGNGGIQSYRDQQRAAARRAIFQPSSTQERDITGDSGRMD